WLKGIDPKSEKVDWVGLNCAACHTGQITYGGKTQIIDGAPALFDFQTFIDRLDEALVQTRDSAAPGATDAGRWDRFATEVLKGFDNPVNRKLRAAAANKLSDGEADAKR